MGLVYSRNGHSSTRPFCGGTLISSRHVLTAAHCLKQVQSPVWIKATIGEHNIADWEANRVDVAEIIKHPNYDSARHDNDYAILRLSQDVPFTSKVSPVCLPDKVETMYEGVLATVTGWGTLKERGSQPRTLQEVDVTVTSNAVCKKAYPRLTSSMICAADIGKDSCQGDSGGPLVARENGHHAVVGLGSFIYYVFNHFCVCL